MIRVAAEMPGERAAAAGALGPHDFEAAAVENTDRGLVDAGPDRFVRTSAEHSNMCGAPGDRQSAPQAPPQSASAPRGNET